MKLIDLDNDTLGMIIQEIYRDGDVVSLLSLSNTCKRLREKVYEERNLIISGNSQNIYQTAPEIHLRLDKVQNILCEDEDFYISDIIRNINFFGTINDLRVMDQISTSTSSSYNIAILLLSTFKKRLKKITMKRMERSLLKTIFNPYDGILENLEYLSLEDCSLKNSDMILLSMSPNLKYLNLSKNSDLTLFTLVRDLKKLEEIDVRETGFKRSDLELIKGTKIKNCISTFTS